MLPSVGKVLTKIFGSRNDRLLKRDRAIVNQINRDVGRVIELPEVKERLQGIDFNIVTSTPEAFTKSLHGDIQVFKKVAVSAGLVAK